MKTRTSKNLSMVVAAACLAAIGASAAPASACGGEWAPEVEIDYRVRGVARAEEMFNQGKTLAAAASVIRMMPHIATLNPNRSKLVERAQHILAVAIARGDGALPIAKEVPDYALGKWAGKTSEERQLNLAFSIKALRQVSEIKKDDPSVRTDLAEALAKVAGSRDEARTILEDLAKKDLVATPEGYATLAELRSQVGDAEGQKLALERCAAMAKSNAVCESGRAQG